MSNFNDTNFNFEQFLSQEADKYRAYPSDKVWNNIRTEMQGKKRWPALIFCFVFIMLAATISTVIFYPPHKEYIALHKTISQEEQIKIANKKNKNSIITKPNANISEKVSNKFIANIVHTTKVNDDKILANYSNSSIENIANNKTFKAEATVITEREHLITESNININKELKSTNLSSIPEHSSIQPKSPDNNKEEINYSNTFKAPKKASSRKLQLQFYVTPSVSYRILQDDKSRANYTNNPNDLQALKSNVNDVVHHKPAFGSEIGVLIMYPITKNFFFKTGLQFNSSQYIVDASQQSGEANISFVENNQLNTVSYQTKYSTKQGVNDVMLDNKVYQLSVPIGLQWNFVDNARWGIAIGATIQPTITLNKNIYLVSTDYKYYTDGAPFFRKTNVNTTTELMFTLKSKDNKWIFGPQIRYQQMPTYNDLYPVKEHRVDYGIKVGFIKSL